MKVLNMTERQAIKINVLKKKLSQLKKVRVLVLSYGFCANFGDRLGAGLLNMILPPWAEVTHSSLPPFWKSPSTDYDLVIIGTGHSVFFKTLDDELLDFLSKVPYCIGIFGTQYRDAIDKEKLVRLFDNIDYWFARNSDDIEFVGDAASSTKVSHLGDWLINAFPITQWTKDDDLFIPGSMGEKRNDILTTIQQIQTYRTVYSCRLHPLLCALTSAERVKFSEQKLANLNLKSGKFDSMLFDIFGRSFPTNNYFSVNKNDVINYKNFAYENTQAMKEVIWNICQKADHHW